METNKSQHLHEGEFSWADALRSLAILCALLMSLLTTNSRTNAQGASEENPLSLQFELEQASPNSSEMNGYLTIKNESEVVLGYEATIYFVPELWNSPEAGPVSLSESLQPGAISIHSFVSISPTTLCSWTLPVYIDLAATPGVVENDFIYAMLKGTSPLSSLHSICNGSETPTVGYDFGDAPQSPDVPFWQPFPPRSYNYPTTSARDGAYHKIWMDYPFTNWLDWTTPLYLSFAPPKLPDDEIDGQPTLRAMGDDFHLPDDEDGVAIETAYGSDPLSCYGNRVRIAPRGIPGWLNAWADFDQDGAFSNQNSEHFIRDRYVNPSGGDQLIGFVAPCLDAYVPWNNQYITPTRGAEIYFRFRYSTDKKLQPTGFASDGEVEDHVRNFVLPPGSCPAKHMNEQIVLMLEGYKGPLNNNSGSCQDLYGKLKSNFIKWGWAPGGVKLIGIYHDTSDCDPQLNLGNWPSWEPNTNITKDTPIAELAWRLAWMIHENWTGDCRFNTDPNLPCPLNWRGNPNTVNQNAPEIDIVAHSMGGLITQYALMRSQFSQDAHARFSARMGYASHTFPVLRNIEDVVTAGTPHGGITLPGGLSYPNLDLLCDYPVTQQCLDLMRDSNLLLDLKLYGERLGGMPPHTQSRGVTGGTQWTTIFSSEDELRKVLGEPAGPGSPWFKPAYSVNYIRPNHKIHHPAQYDDEPFDEEYHDFGSDESLDDMYFKDQSNCGDHDRVEQGGLGKSSAGGAKISDKSDSYPHVNWRINLGCVLRSW